ncbi:hypothetical protein [Neisseria meningitidis]|uniref:DUF6853 family protein n=1 Tax=Neisseria meningitidis TaxID=487 RepID=UPI0002A50C9E|nr:hypothetical protein [Neisseria meningitidis]ELL04845.1 hypothetical protein NM4119_0462 [Neisseria meningitidis 4119]
MKNFNVVKESLRELGIKQGFDLYEKATTEKLNSEDPLDLQWLSNYSSDWNDELEEDFDSFFQHMKEYQYAIDNEDIKSACSSLCEAMLYVGNIKIFFEFLKSDMIRLLRGESKTTDFQWPQFDE